MAKKIDIAGQLNSAAADNKLADASQIYDSKKGKFQEKFNEEIEAKVESYKQKLEQDVTDAVANLVGGASETFDTLKEFEDWINNDESGAAAIAKQTNENKTAISDLNANTGISEYPAFDTAVDYAVGDVVKYEGRLYRFTAEHAQGEWIGTDAESWSERKEIEGKVTELGSKVNSVVGGKQIVIDKGYEENKYYLKYNDVSALGDSNGSKRYYPIDLSEFIGGEVEVDIATTTDGSYRLVGVGDKVKFVDFCYELDFLNNNKRRFKLTKESHILYISISKEGVLNSIDVYVEGHISSIEKTIEVLKSDIASIAGIKLSVEDSGYSENEYYNNIDSVLSYGSSGGSKRYYPIDLSEFIGYKVEVNISTTNNESMRLVGLGNGVGFTEYVYDKDFYNKNYAIFDVTSSSNILYISISKESVLNSVNIKSGKLNDIEEQVNNIEGQLNNIDRFEGVIYVDAENGDDNNQGTKENNAVKTFSKAIELSENNSTIVLIGETTEQINISQKKTISSLRIIGKAGVRNRIIRGEIINSANNYAENVYYINRDNLDFAYAGRPLFQHDVKDVSTKIVESDRLPMQRGVEYRCDSTKIAMASSVDEVISSIEQKYFFDSENTRLYFKIADGTNLSKNPIVIPTLDDSVIYGNNGSVKLEVENIGGYYARFDLSNCNGALIKDCKAAYAFSSGAFLYDNSVGIEFIRCEACGTWYVSTNGDGFNGHANKSPQYAEGEPLAKWMSVCLTDCWSHDNNDDGYSDHERAECIVRGGLFEYNGKAGITPAYGSHCTCYDVISRNNYNGFYYTGVVEESEGGHFGQIVCYNCISMNNQRGNGYKAGFLVDGTNNVMKLYNCKSIGNDFGYYAAIGASMKITDCSAKDNINLKSGNGIMEINNTPLVE